MLKRIIYLLIILLCCTFAAAQEKKSQEPNKNWKIGINSGVANFTGEQNIFKNARLNHINHLKGEMNLTKTLSQSKFERKVYWYAKIWIGASHFWKKSGSNSLIEENWKMPTILMGTGYSFRLTDQIQYNSDTKWSWVNTDRLDGGKKEIIFIE